MHPLQMINHLVLPRERASTTLDTPTTPINRTPESRIVAIMSRGVMALHVYQALERGARAGRYMAFVLVLAGDAVAEDEVDDGVLWEGFHVEHGIRYIADSGARWAWNGFRPQIFGVNLLFGGSVIRHVGAAGAHAAVGATLLLVSTCRWDKKVGRGKNVGGRG
jgi:hypothetical protein